MKLFVLFTVAALIVGGVYHTEVSRYFANLTKGSSSAGATSVVDSFKGTSNSGNNLMDGVGNALDR